MQPKPTNNNDLELEAIAALQAEGHVRLTEQNGQATQATPVVVRISVALAGSAAIGLLFLVEWTG
ncbi:MAG: hypothetical protein OSB07_02315 [Dehalococcoidia bacterium]|nr:hypothetical protein [Dehalococcoidia bacterium]